jgi:hypothetical protein
MPGFSHPSRPRRELGEPLLDALLEGRSLPPDAPVELCAVAEMLADLAGPAEPSELAGEAAARLGLARTAHPAGISPAAHRSARRRRSWTSVPGAVRLGGALIAAAVGLGGAAAAYAGALPGPIQDFAHHLIGAPPAHRASPTSPRPGPGTSQPGARHGSHSGRHKAKGHSKAKSHGKAKGHSKASKPAAATTPPGLARHHAHPAQPASPPVPRTLRTPRTRPFPAGQARPAYPHPLPRANYCGPRVRHPRPGSDGGGWGLA